jgi:hypothetical protein
VALVGAAAATEHADVCEVIVQRPVVGAELHGIALTTFPQLVGARKAVATLAFRPRIIYACVMHIDSIGVRAVALGVAVLAAALVAGCGSDARTPAQGPVPQSAAAPAAPMVVVPRLVGRQQEDAHRIAARSGLKLRWTGFVGKYGNGRYNIGCVQVLSQSPVAGERRPRGAQIAVIEAACRTPNQRPHGVTTGGQPG